MNFEFENDNTQTAYIAFGNTAPVGTYTVAPGVTVFNNGTIVPVGETISLNPTTIFEVAPGQTLTGVDVQQFVSGRFLVSLGSPLQNVDNTEFNYQSGGDSDTRWDKVEASIYAPGSTNVNSVDLTATDFIGLNFTVDDIRNGSDVGALQTSNVSLTQAFTDIAEGATNTSSPDEKYVVVTGANGLYVPALGENVLRIVAPSTVPPAGLPAYTSMSDYLTAVKNALGTTGTITVAGLYSSKGTSPTTETQNFSFTASFDTAGDLVLVSQPSTSATQPSTPTGISAGQTIVIAAADLETGLLGDNPPYTVNSGASDISANDVYAAAVRDILGGFDLGFVQSSAINPNTGEAFSATSTASWYSPQLTDSDAYAYAQPTNNTYYDQYASILAQLGNAYGFPFSDLVQGAQLAPQDGDTIKIVINSDTTSSGGSGSGGGSDSSGGSGSAGGSTADTGGGSTAFTPTNPSDASGSNAAFAQFFGGGVSLTVFNGSGVSSATGPIALTAANVAMTVSGGNALTDSSAGENSIAATNSVVIFSAANDTISAATGATTLFGSSAGQTNFTLAGDNSSVTGGSGSIVGTSSGANTTLVGGTGVSLFTVTGSNSLAVAGTSGITGIDEKQATSPEVIATNPLGNSGQLVTDLGAGATSVIGGGGSSTVTGGSGPDAYIFVKGHSGGSEFVIGLNASDNIGFAGYGYSPQDLPIEHVGLLGDVVTLNDGTSITFAGFYHTLF
jgi:hypothetical protein